ncbi:hypothetical protein ADL21_11435 [Streptomyces albus subsp. albus]|nr:hypothetical protein ADL21_11435 [Streptomyces albus subsp. albus]
MADAGSETVLSRRLNKLFADIRPDGPNGRCYTNDEVAAALRAAHAGLRVTGGYLSALRTGAKANPSTGLVTALAHFFGVPPAYFFDDATAAQTDAEIALAQAVHRHGVRQLALRANQLTPEGLAAVTEVVDQLLRSVVPPTPAAGDNTAPGPSEGP